MFNLGCSVAGVIIKLNECIEIRVNVGISLHCRIPLSYGKKVLV